MKDDSKIESNGGISSVAVDVQSILNMNRIIFDSLTHDLTSCEYIREKLNNARNQIEPNAAHLKASIEAVAALCKKSWNEGLISMAEHVKANKEYQILKSLNYVFAKGVYTNGQISLDDYKAYSIAKTILCGTAKSGVEFIDMLLYYEGYILATRGWSYNDVKIKLNAIIGFECIDEIVF